MTKKVKVEPKSSDAQRVAEFLATIATVQVSDEDGDGMYNCFNCGDYETPLIKGEDPEQIAGAGRGYCLNCLYEESVALRKAA